MKKTKILCTIGPASTSPIILEKMYGAGMNGARINTVFGDFDQYEEIVKNVRSVGEIPILMDLGGPGLRTVVQKPMPVKGGNTLMTGFEDQAFRFNYDIYGQLEVGDQIFIGDGKLQTEVVEKEGRIIRILVKNEGVLEDRKGVNIPHKSLDMPTLTERDLKVLEFAEEHEIEFIGLSFTRNRQDLLDLRRRAGDLRSSVVAKIENFQGVENFEEVLEEADGVMVARGDLGVEVEPERVPLLQKRMIQRCNQEGLLVITATEMLDSMIHRPTPTRAEVSDVANAILDGTDVVMLSGETSIGKYPAEAVSMMAGIARETEKAVVSRVKEEGFRNISRTISISIWQTAQSMPLDKVVTMTRTGYTARVIARFKLRQPIIAVTPSRLVRDQLALVYGVYPIQFDYEREKDRILSVAQELYSRGLLDVEDVVLFTAGFRTHQRHASNVMEIHTLKELLEFALEKA